MNQTPTDKSSPYKRNHRLTKEITALQKINQILAI